ncbi:MAG: hypothetical protein GX758_04655 [Tenericutes bacterium]|nr:hypothetical protein [Mycoplasmatota bacterium]
MQKEKFIIIPNKKELKLYEKYSFNNFILPLKNYSIGFDVYYSIDEINELSNMHNIYVMINKFLHNDIISFKEIYTKFNKKIKFIVEDIGLTEIIDKSRIILFENHIISNYKAINYLNKLNYNSVVVNNDLTITELEEILDKTNSNLYYYIITRNNLMYSKRKLVSNFNEYYKINNKKNVYDITETISKEKLIVKEENDSSIVYYSKLFCANKYINKLEKISNFIINFTSINEVEEQIILDSYDKENLVNLINCDYYFLENDIKYKVGDLK